PRTERERKGRRHFRSGRNSNRQGEANAALFMIRFTLAGAQILLNSVSSASVAAMRACRGWGNAGARRLLAVPDRMAQKTSEELMRFPTIGYSIALAAAVAAGGVLSPPAQAADVVKLGAPLALTGSLADEGKKQDAIWKMWL